MKRLLILMLILTIAALGATVALAQDCTDEIGCVVIEEGDPFAIGYMLTVSGATSFLGEDSVGGIEIAIANYLEMNTDSVITEIEVVGEDSLCSTEGGQTAAQRIVSDETILGVIGTNCSSAAEGGLPIISEAGYLMISSSNTSPRLTDSDTEAGGTWQPGYYRTAHNDLFQGAVAANYAYDELGARTVATVHDGSSYADGLQAVFANVFAELGGEVVFQGAVNVGDTDMTAILTDIASNAPDLIYVPIFEPESNFFTDQSADVPGLEDTILFGADASFVDGFGERTGEAAIGQYFSAPAVSGERYDDFLAQWDEMIGGVPPSGFHAHSYDATIMLLQAIDAVAVVNDDGTVVIGRQALRDAMSSVTDFDGLTGVLTCGPTGDCATGEALAIFLITEAEVNDGNWPPAIVYTP